MTCMMRLRQLFLLMTLLVWATCGLLPASARAETALSGLEGLATIVDDSELADMRGKFLTPQGISYFGFEIQSRWQTPDGAITAARLVLNFDLSGGGKAAPQIFISWKRDEGDSAMNVSGPSGGGQSPAVAGSINIPASGGGLDTVQGAVQSQLIAGTDNKVINGMTIRVTGDPAARPDTSGLTPVSGGSTQTFADGDKLQFVVSGSGVGIQMTNGPSDTVRQGVNSDLHQLSQQVVLSSNFNDIANSMNLTIGINPGSDLNQLNASGAMSAMRGTGY